MDYIYVKKNHNKGKIISNEIINFRITLFEKKYNNNTDLHCISPD